MPEPLEIRYREIGELRPYERNARTHSDEQIAQIAASISAFGWTNPVLLDERDGIIAGHGRIAAAIHLGLERVPTICLRGLTDAQRRALVLADNKLALNAGWDMATLSSELQELDTGEFPLTLTGFSAQELESLLTWAPDGLAAGLTDPDEAPELSETPVSRGGDVWVCGRHRILCGDSTQEPDVRTVLGEVKPLLMVTDPPYGVDYDPDWRNRADRANGKPYGASAIGKVKNDDRADWREAWALFPGEVCYVWHAGRHASAVQSSLESAAFDIRCQIVWAKPRFVISRGHYHWQHEPCWYAVRKGGTGHWSGDRSQTTLWTIEHVKSETGHGTQKPVECMRRPIENNSAPGQPVYDPFLGSGTTVIAAEQTGRACFGIELNPGYVDVSVRRWQNFTGKQGVRESDGKIFDEVANEGTKTAAIAPETGARQSGKAPSKPAGGKTRAGPPVVAAAS